MLVYILGSLDKRNNNGPSLLENLFFFEHGMVELRTEILDNIIIVWFVFWACIDTCKLLSFISNLLYKTLIDGWMVYKWNEKSKMHHVTRPQRKKDILTSFKRPKWPVRPNERLHFEMLSHDSSLRTTNQTKHN